MEIKYINIVDDILKSRIALHDFGKPVSARIEQILDSITGPTLLVINLRRANPMDYEFVNISFANVIARVLKAEEVFIIFQVDNTEFVELCTGMVDILAYKMESGLTAAQLLAKNGFAMIYQDEHDITKYITCLDEKHLSILDFIDREGPLMSSDIITEFKIIPEETTEILNALKKAKFILQQEGHTYVSLKSFLNQTT